MFSFFAIIVISIVVITIIITTTMIGLCLKVFAWEHAARGHAIGAPLTITVCTI